MHKSIVINTSPIIALVAGLGDLSILRHFYKSVVVTKEVADELLFSGLSNFAAKEFVTDTFLSKIENRQEISMMLRKVLDIGESSVIQYAIDHNIQTVCIDETTGRRIARLNGLSLTGSIGILIKAKQSGLVTKIKPVITKMQNQGIYLSDKVIEIALKQAGEFKEKTN